MMTSWLLPQASSTDMMTSWLLPQASSTDMMTSSNLFLDFFQSVNADVVVAARNFLQLTSSLMIPALALLIPDLYCSSSSSTFLPADFIDSVPDHIFA
ncbi:coronatine-insensitive protein 1-like [Dorcoceras hygrometricum]|uniref:Coronatine-insensitive protein 1-like n=1 Tax=Dorcoceras hygrometricum TaxID=472368 RepID=A0A2Z6ZUI9_9LAMI|nr:coronatine-insensitive protein 1-like [Dorcoceras hygrometricum]